MLKLQGHQWENGQEYRPNIIPRYGTRAFFLLLSYRCEWKYSYFRFLSFWLKWLKNKFLESYSRNRGNDLATVRIAAICGSALSNNSFWCKGQKLLGKDNTCYQIFAFPFSISIIVSNFQNRLSVSFIACLLSTHFIAKFVKQDPFLGIITIVVTESDANP